VPPTTVVRISGDFADCFHTPMTLWTDTICRYYKWTTTAGIIFSKLEQTKFCS